VLRRMRALRALLAAGLLAAPQAAAQLDDEALASWVEALAARDGPELLPAALLGLSLPYERPAGQPLRGRARARPAVPPQWSANLLYEGDMMGMNNTGGVGRYLYDRAHQRTRMTYRSTIDYFRLNRTQMRDVLTAISPNSSQGERMMTFGEGRDGACVEFSGQMMGPVTDMWAWLSLAEHTGTRAAFDGPCDVWTARFNKSWAEGFIEACFSADGTARDMTQSFTGRFDMFQKMVFSNVSVGMLSDDVFAPTYSCAENFPAAPCEGRGVETLQLYRIFGPPEPMELRNRNTGDDLGDLAFVCTQASGESYRQKQVTWWSVEVNTSYGQYALCNFNGTRNICTGGALDRVGRRFSQMSGDGPVLGQCSANGDVGSQYSFPEAAHCPDGVHPGPGAGCGWGFAKALRTIEAECVLSQRGLMEACRSERGHAPFVKAQRIFRAAFESDDPSKGGCPDAAPPRLQLVVV